MGNRFATPNFDSYPRVEDQTAPEGNFLELDSAQKAAAEVAGKLRKVSRSLDSRNACDGIETSGPKALRLAPASAGGEADAGHGALLMVDGTHEEARDQGKRGHADLQSFAS